MTRGGGVADGRASLRRAGRAAAVRGRQRRPPDGGNAVVPPKIVKSSPTHRRRCILALQVHNAGRRSAVRLLAGWSPSPPAAPAAVAPISGTRQRPAPAVG